MCVELVEHLKSVLKCQFVQKYERANKGHNLESEFYLTWFIILKLKKVIKCFKNCSKVFSILMALFPWFITYYLCLHYKGLFFIFCLYFKQNWVVGKETCVRYLADKNMGFSEKFINQSSLRDARVWDTPCSRPCNLFNLSSRNNTRTYIIDLLWITWNKTYKEFRIGPRT